MGYGSLRRGRQLGTDVVRAAMGRAQSCHRAQTPAGDVTSAEKPRTLPIPTPLPTKGWLCWSDRAIAFPAPWVHILRAGQGPGSSTPQVSNEPLN